MMARVTQVYSIDEVARRIGESLDLIEIVSWNDDNIDYGEMIRVYNGTDESLVTFTERGIESLQELLADLRTWEGGIHQFLIGEQCDPDVIETIMEHEKNT
ncbi:MULTISPECIES: hypothetical protein [Rhodobacterales]|nr:hypothetical protein [Salipiger bermudensis]MCA1288700.1 hypothetical protein [Salipiger bermudensis]|tara:strand:+ start:118 stop:420 length:303 start_codon:yes stop_codon:yes gene_type:complete